MNTSANKAYLQHVVRTFCIGARPLPFKRFVQMVWEIAKSNAKEK